LVGNNLAAAPANEEAEISVFGPGYGESVLVHLGFGDWLIVDSCVDKTRKNPAPITYLRSIGIDPSTAVKIIIASHWHDDHVRGLASIFEECTSAQFCCSVSLNNIEFLTLVGAEKYSIESRVQEFGKILKLIQARKEGRSQSAGPEWAIENKRVWQRTAQPMPVEIFSLSPSSGAVTLALRQFAQLLPQTDQPKRQAIAVRPNHAAVVLWVKIGDLSVVLGSDLEETEDPSTGWSVIVDSKARPNGKAYVFKIPHHGSSNGDQPRVWSEMLIDEPLAVLTPFVNGRTELPTRSDVRRIQGQTPNTFSTNKILSNQQIKRHGAVEKMIKETVKTIRVIPNTPGHVRLRKTVVGTSNTNWSVELFDGAVDLKDVR
jgi:beta-lactamase superfamily II metal-dependent hydrolase